MTEKLCDFVFSCPYFQTSCTATLRLLGPYNSLGTESKADKHLGETAQLLCWKKNSCHDCCLIESARTHSQKTYQAARTGHKCLRIQLQKINIHFLKKKLYSFSSIHPPLLKRKRAASTCFSSSHPPSITSSKLKELCQKSRC